MDVPCHPRDGTTFSSLTPTTKQLLDAVGEAVIVTTPEGAVVAWNRAAEALYGWSADEALGQDIVTLTSPGPTEAADQIMEQLRAGNPWSGEFQVRCRDASTPVVSVTNTPVLDEHGNVTAIVGISRDMTESRWHESAFRRRQEQLSFAFEAVEMGSWSWDMATGVVEWDTAMEALYGLPPGEFGGTFDSYMQLVHPEDRDHTADHIDVASEPGQDLVFEHRVEWPDGSVHWLEGRGRTLTDDEGTLVGMVGVGINIDNRKLLEEAARDAATSRATAHLVAQLEAAERIAKLGSWYWDAAENVVTLSVEMAQLLDCDDTMSGQEFRDALQRVVDPDDVALLFDAPIRMLTDRKPFAIEQRMHIGASPRVVIHRGEIAEGPDGTVIGIRGTTQDITEQRRMEEALVTARENIARERRAVRVLNEALVHPDFPTVAGFEFAARYVAAQEEVDIGGDWYDAFETPGGKTMLTIGDVSGHGLRAARLMAKLRHAARAYACLDARPEHVLVRLNDFLHHFGQGDEFATIQVCVLDPAQATVTIVSAGHPPPVFVDPASTSLVGVVNTEPASFFPPDRQPEPTTITIPGGAALLLYTDGLVERRNESLDVGLRRLTDHITSTRWNNVDELCDAALDGALDGTEQRDDVCLLVVHRIAEVGVSPDQDGTSRRGS